MKVCTCRVCCNDFFPTPLLKYQNMPKAAQNFPDAASVAGERGTDLAVHQCTGCGLIQLDNEPVPYFREVIRAVGVSPIIREAKTRQFSELVAKYSLRGKKVIEIGCGRGEFLELLREVEVEAFGLEYGNCAVKVCQEKGLKVFRGYPEPELGAFPHGPFDAFFLLMFLEHMPHPNTALKAIWNNLTDGGIGLVEVPNFSMMVRKRIFSEFTTDHLLYFTEETFHNTLRINGFEVLDCCDLRDEYVLSAVVRKRRPLEISSFHEYQARITSEINQFIDRFGAKRVAIWGAGHQALAIIALSGISAKVRYVVDSAPFKQGRFTPATHLPIVPPGTLRQDPVEAVIVIGGSYSDEIADVLRREYPSAMQTAILRDFGLEVMA
ncbi:MAG: methyltransferase domain-containing protein [Candidatus Riflebacteria bacterium]|nr:methyltransferase domain-containing protein [Candidatus Riflebacteria bacterium]